MKTEIKKIINEYVSQSSIHGISNVFKAKRFFFMVLWTIVTLASTIYCIFLITKSISSYMEYEVISRIDDWYKSPLDFPAVTFCNLNRPKTNYSLDEVLLYCQFNSKQCNSSDFVKYIDLQYGECYRFNHKKDKKSFKSGSLYGLQIHFFTGLMNDFLDVGSKEYGLKINIHNHSALSTVSSGVQVSPGFKTYIMIKQIYNLKQPAPYNECQNDASYPKQLNYLLKNMDRFDYKQSNCIDLYFMDYFTKKCNYSGNLDSICESFNERLFNSNGISVFSCLADSTSEFYEKQTKINLDDCPLECESMSYSMTTSMAKYPTRSQYFNSEKLRRLFNGSYNYENLTDSLVSFIVFYEELDYTVISQKEKLEIEDLISTIGGLFGLFLGMSFLSFIEFIELLGEIIFSVIDHVKIRNSY